MGGDLHDSFAWTLYEDGNFTGNPVAVNLGITGVTCPGWGPGLYPFLRGLEPILGSEDAVYDLINDMSEGQNEGNVYTEVQYKGFYAVKATKVRGSRIRYRELVLLSISHCLRPAAANTHYGVLSCNAREYSCKLF